MNLYLDDVRNPPDDSWTIVRTAEEAKPFLASGVVECASLDHDLGECEECEAARGYQTATVTCRHRMTGYDLVKWMAETGFWSKRKPICHSANPVGKANILATIERYFPR